MSRSFATALCASAALLSATAVATPAFADALPSEAALSRVITVPRDKSLSFRLNEPATKIVVAQPDIAEVVATTDRSFYVRGLQPGSTNLLVYGPGGRLMEVIDVRVGYDAKGLQSDIETALPGENIRVQGLGEGLLLSGTVSTASIAARAKAMADRYAPDGVTSALMVSASQEVVLEVRVMEATRSSLQDMGFAASFTSGNTTVAYGTGLIGTSAPAGIASFTTHAGANGITASLQALEERGIVRTLARPTLVAVSGGKASFLAGGEFPYPVPQGLNQITLEFRTYGVKLDFTPTVQDNGLIRMAVAPEVSQLDASNSLRINGVTVPGLITRKADTTVEIRDGDSLAIGGMFMHTYNNDVRQLPGLGDIPIIGTLFRSARWARNETELVIIVTPHIVTAHDFDKAAKTVAVSGPEPSAARFMFMGKESLDPPMGNDMRGSIGNPLPVAAQARTAPKAWPTAMAQAQIPVAAPVATAAPAPVMAVAQAAPVTSAPAPAVVVAHAAPIAAPVVAVAQAAPVKAAPAPVRTIVVAQGAPLVIPALTPAPAPVAAPTITLALATPAPVAPIAVPAQPQPVAEVDIPAAAPAVTEASTQSPAATPAPGEVQSQARAEVAPATTAPSPAIVPAEIGADVQTVAKAQTLLQLRGAIIATVPASGK